jgi:hypothetical protein
MSESLTPAAARATETSSIKRRRGRPPGSRNRPKPAEGLPPVRPAALKVANAAKYMDVSVSYVNRLIREGRLEVATLNSPKLVLVASIDRLLGIGAP